MINCFDIKDLCFNINLVLTIELIYSRKLSAKSVNYEKNIILGYLVDAHVQQMNLC